MQRATFIASSLMAAATAQMGIDCFVMSELKGSQDRSHPLDSDLPMLMGGFDQDLFALKLAVYYTERENDIQGKSVDRLDALQLILINDSTEKSMSLNMIGNKSSASLVDYFDLDEPLDRIDFLYTENRVCNVKFVDEDEEVYNYFDEDVWEEGDDIHDKYSPYAVYNDYCIEGISGIEYMSIYMGDILDLVGLRGRANNDGPGISSLGFIWYNDSEDVCLDVDYGQDTKLAREGMLSPDAAEAMITSSKRKSDEIFANLLVDYNERNKGGALIDSIIKGTFADTTSNQNRSKILDQIELETDLIKSKGDVSNDLLLSLVEDLLLNEQMAEKERKQIEDRQQDFLDNWEDFQGDFLRERLAQQKIKDVLEAFETQSINNSNELTDLITKQLTNMDENGMTTTDVAELAEGILDQAENDAMSGDQFDQSIGKLMSLSFVVLFIGMMVGCCGYYAIQRIMAYRKDADLARATKKPEQTFHAVDVVSARGPANAEKSNGAHVAVPMTTTGEILEKVQPIAEDDINKFAGEDKMTDAQL